MSTSPLSSPVSEPARSVGNGPAWNTLAAAGVGVLVSLYIAATVSQIVWAQQGAADATTLGTYISHGASTDALETFKTTLDAHITSMHTASLLYQAAFWVMFVAFFGWQAILRSRLRAIGRSFDRRSMTAWQVWRVGLFVSIIMIFVAQGSAPTTPEAIASNYHKLMIYYAVRAVVGVAYLWVVYSVWRSAANEFAAAPALTVRPVPAHPWIPTGYSPAPQDYPAVPHSDQHAMPALPPQPSEPSPWAPPAVESTQP